MTTSPSNEDLGASEQPQLGEQPSVSKSVTSVVPLEQIKILRAFGDGNSEYCYGYAYFENETGLDRKTLKKHMTELRQRGLVYYARGLMNEDGEVRGSGFGVEYSKRELVWELIEEAPDKLEHQLRKDMNEALTYAGFYDYAKREKAVKSLMSLVDEYTKNKGSDLPTRSDHSEVSGDSEAQS